MNSLRDDELNKIAKLRQKLYSRTLTDNASKINPLHKHDLTVPKSWENKNEDKVIIDNGLDMVVNNKKETVSDFLNNKFSNHTADYYSKERSEKIEQKIDKTTSALRVAQAELNAKNNSSIYPDINAKSLKNNTIDNTVNTLESDSVFQSDYHPDIKTVKIGETADMQDFDKNKIRPKKKNITFGFIIFMFIFFFFVGASFYTYIHLSQGTNTISTNKIDIKITGPVSVKSGDITEFIVDITNNNSAELILSDLVIQYPDGSKSPLDRNVDLTNERLSVGTIKPGETIRQKHSVVLFGEQNITKTIRYSYEFNINDSATVFKTDKDISVFISGSPIIVEINNVKEINNNQELNFDITLTSNTEEVLKNIQLRVEYPFGYRLLESTPKPVADNNTWSFDEITPLSTTTIRLKGKFIGEVNVEKNFRFTLGIEDTKTKEMLTVLSTQDNLVSIVKPFVITRLLIEGDNVENKPVDYEQTLQSDLIITNNLPQPITDVYVEVLFNGVLIDRRSVSSSKGFYDSAKDLIFWDPSLSADLLRIPPGESREFSFNLSILKSTEDLIRTLRRSTSDLTINVKAQRLGENRVNETILASTKKQLRLKTDSVLVSDLLHESGVYSPEVGQETVFRYVAAISNTANSLKDVVFTAKLPPNASWKNIYSPNITPSSVRYNQSTREITINLSDIEAGAGIDRPLKEFYFNIGFTPTLTQSKQTPVIMLNPTITATDSFTQERKQLKNNSITTNITKGNFSEGDSRVK